MEVRRQKVKVQQLQKQLDAVKAEEAQLLDKAAKAALKVEALLAGDGGGVSDFFVDKKWKLLLPGQPSRQPEVCGSRAPTQGTKGFSLKEKHGDQHIMYIV